MGRVSVAMLRLAVSGTMDIVADRLMIEADAGQPVEAITGDVERLHWSGQPGRSYS